MAHVPDKAKEFYNTGPRLSDLSKAKSEIDVPCLCFGHWLGHEAASVFFARQFGLGKRLFQPHHLVAVHFKQEIASWAAPKI